MQLRAGTSGYERVRAGTSGLSYKEWKGPFYPEKLPANQMPGYYAERLSTVEINNTFYRMPKRDMLASWARKVPDDFVFVLKASRKITHHARLTEADTDDDRPPELVSTTDWGYLRLRRADYTDDALRIWRTAIEAQPWKEAFVFFRHEDEGAGPRLAHRLLTLDD